MSPARTAPLSRWDHLDQALRRLLVTITLATLVAGDLIRLWHQLGG